jgi:hypothetical protein
MVWASIAVAAMAGRRSTGSWLRIERRLTFWHPSQRAEAAKNDNKRSQQGGKTNEIRTMTTFAAMGLA